MVAAVERFDERRLASSLRGLDAHRLLRDVEAIHRQVVDELSAGRPGPALRMRIAAVDDEIDGAFAALRPNDVEYARLHFG